MEIVLFEDCTQVIPFLAFTITAETLKLTIFKFNGVLEIVVANNSIELQSMTRLSEHFAPSPLFNTAILQLFLYFQTRHCNEEQSCSNSDLSVIAVFFLNVVPVTSFLTSKLCIQLPSHARKLFISRKLVSENVLIYSLQIERLKFLPGSVQASEFME